MRIYYRIWKYTMTDNEFYVYKPDYAVHPGEYLEEVLESREIKKKDFAECLGDQRETPEPDYQ